MEQLTRLVEKMSARFVLLETQLKMAETQRPAMRKAEGNAWTGSKTHPEQPKQRAITPSKPHTLERDFTPSNSSKLSPQIAVNPLSKVTTEPSPLERQGDKSSDVMISSLDHPTPISIKPVRTKERSQPAEKQPLKLSLQPNTPLYALSPIKTHANLSMPNQDCVATPATPVSLLDVY